MEKIVLIDGNNLLFRSYYATAYTGNLMKNSKGFPTNGLYGFTNMINKIIKEESPDSILVAFDKGKTFRHVMYKEYKAGRSTTPDELKIQFPVAKDLLDKMGIKYYEIDDYEADDIIGTFADMASKDDEIDALIISSDKDLLQLISKGVDMKMLKNAGNSIVYNTETFMDEYGFEPMKIVDLKALMGDASDNIPGVKGIGEKTAMKLIHEYESLDGIYENIDKIKGKLQEKLINDKEAAYKSFELATIYKTVKMEIDFSDLKYMGPKEDLKDMYRELEFYSFLKEEKTNVSFKNVEDIKEVVISKPSSIFIDLDGNNYHSANVTGISIYNDLEAYYMSLEQFIDLNDYSNINYTFDYKKLYVLLNKYNIELPINYDMKLACYLLEYNVNNFDPLALRYNVSIDKDILRSKVIYDNREDIIKLLEKKGLKNLYDDIEFPLSTVLGRMELNGVKINKDILTDMGDVIKGKIDVLTEEIYELTGTTFNIASPLQLGEVLFDKLELKHTKKTKRGYSTSIDVLNKLKEDHPVINKLIEYRMLTKLYSTYIEGLINMIMPDGKIHTIYTQTLTRTGRLSSIEPNLQNIPVRSEYGRLIRKAFIPTNDLIVGGDYSQVELRILASIANIDALIEAFNNDIDIHTKTASDIFSISIEEVTKKQRTIAKAVNFGIIYGISAFGLSENLHIYPNEAKTFMELYFNKYPGIKTYMQKEIENAYDKGYVKTMFDRIRTIDELNNKNAYIRKSGERIVLNTPIQGTSADIIKLAMIKIDSELIKRNLESKMIIQVHDELIFDIKSDEKEVVEKIIKDGMENIVKLSVPLKVDINSGISWYEAK